MHTRQSGFTLIEIAIVLVIIGLILGGALKGQELIATAKVRSTINQLDGVRAAYYAFQDRYRALPGDYAQAANNLPDAVALGVVNGQGNGLINTNGERGQAWLHLSAAGFLTGQSFNGTGTGNNWNCSALTCLTNPFSGAMLLTFNNQAASANNSHELWTGARIPVDIVAEIDRKIDDGVPGTGTFQSARGLNAGTCVAGGTYNVATANPQQNCGGVIVGL
ncbi:MAG TPA: prepilin-type cleavage/methylation domain-containing protein [Gammaproteobacteria bacterium]|nr:prepilin-type cleavage/methylation domain-containing protein [Gammaproteobacteria bacterium]